MLIKKKKQFAPFIWISLPREWKYAVFTKEEEDFRLITLLLKVCKLPREVKISQHPEMKISDTLAGYHSRLS